MEHFEMLHLIVCQLRSNVQSQSMYGMVIVAHIFGIFRWSTLSAQLSIYLFAFTCKWSFRMQSSIWGQGSTCRRRVWWVDGSISCRVGVESSNHEQLRIPNLTLCYQRYPSPLCNTLDWLASHENKSRSENSEEKGIVFCGWLGYPTHGWWKSLLSIS